ncbi:MAG: glutaminyl-peptide cyclotransferase [Bacteroidales bacterium]|nr:glutaminyl-peptide cyclotransferase [Bacteroidales bacterium]
MRSILLIAAVLLLPACSTAAKVKQYRVKVVKEYPHDPAAYTQGLFFHDGKLYESTGQFGNSSFRTVDLETGKSLTSMQFNRTYFAEGSVIFKDDLYILTWTNKVVFKYDPVTLAYRSTQRYPREGWGLTTDGKSLIASDGTASLYFMDASLKVEKTLPVRMNGRPVRYLNELEWIDGKIWANVYTTDLIVVINPKSGEVEATVDCTGLLPQSLRDADTDVLNGIAYDGKNVYLTGKNWKRLYQIELIDK